MKKKLSRQVLFVWFFVNSLFTTSIAMATSESSNSIGAECRNGRAFHEQVVRADTLDNAWKAVLENCPSLQSELETYEQRVIEYFHQFHPNAEVSASVFTDKGHIFQLEQEIYEHGDFYRNALPFWISVKKYSSGAGMIDRKRADFAFVVDEDDHMGAEPEFSFLGVLPLNGKSLGSSSFLTLEQFHTMWVAKLSKE